MVERLQQNGLPAVWFISLFWDHRLTLLLLLLIFHFFFRLLMSASQRKEIRLWSHYSLNLIEFIVHFTSFVISPFEIEQHRIRVGMKRMSVCVCFNFRLFSNIQSIAFILIHLHAHLWMKWRRARVSIRRGFIITTTSIYNTMMVCSKAWTFCLHVTRAAQMKCFTVIWCSFFLSIFWFDGASNHIRR